MKRYQTYTANAPLASRLVVVVASVGLVGSLAGAVYQLRQNNLEMLRLREAVFRADESNGDVNGALNNLRNYVAQHMNTPLPKLGDEKQIQLKYTYDRLVAAEQQRVSTAREKVTADATAECERQLPQVRLTERVKCVQAYIQAHPVTEQTIVKELYTFDFVSPKWSPDLAGWLLVVSALCGAVLLLQLIVTLLVRSSIREV